MTLRRTSIFILALNLLAVRAIAADDAAAKADLAQMQGEWTMLFGEQSGQPIPDAMRRNSKRICQDDQIVVHVGGMLIMKAKVVLDASKNPRTIDYDVTDGPNKGKTQLGIYELAGDTVKFCFAQPGHERPIDFATKSGDGQTLSVWKKQTK